MHLCVQLQTASIKAVAERYENFETISPSPSLVHSVPMKQVIKTSIFTAKRDTAADTGLDDFNAIARESATISIARPSTCGRHSTQSLQNPLIKEYTLNHSRIPNMI